MGPLGSGSCLVANRADVMPANFRPTDRTDVLTHTPEQQHLVYKANIYFNCYICYWTVFTYVVFYFPYLGYNGYYFLINFCVCLLVNADCRTPAVMPAKINPVPMVFPHKSVLFLWESRDMCSHNHEKATENPWVSPVPIPMQLSTRELKTACAALAFVICCKCFPHCHCHDKQKGTVNKWRNEDVYVCCWKILYKSLMIEKKLL